VVLRIHRQRKPARAAPPLAASAFATPAIIGGRRLKITSFDEVTTVFIASPRTTTLPVRLFVYIQDNIDPLVAAVSAALIGLTFVAMLLIDRLDGLERLLVGRGRG
jgi:ABC-type spermidine/putrescine transport system permease subunit II